MAGLMDVRRRLIVNKELQLKLAAIQAMSMVLVAFACLVTYKILLDYVQLNLPASPELDRYIVNISRALTGQLVILLIIGISVSILISNRIVGPVYRLEQDIGALLKDIGKNVSKRVTVRKGDEITSLVDTVNKLLDRFELMYNRKKQFELTIKNRFADMKDRFRESPEILSCIADIEKEVEE